MAEENSNNTKKIGEKEITKKIRENPWIISTIVLGVFVIVLLFLSFSGMTGNVVSQSDIKAKTIDLFKTVRGVDVVVTSVKDVSGMYELAITADGTDAGTVFMSKDGAYIGGMSSIADIEAAASGSSATNSETPAEVPKTDKPKVQAFIFSYCPYGLQFEKALIPVYNLLKNRADIDIVAIGAMHGEYEHQESLRQISIEQLYSRDKLFAYLTEFNANTDIGACNGDDTCLNKYLPSIYSKLGIDKTKVDNYMKSSAEAIYTQQGSIASQLGISGSPTFVINGVESQVSRTADAIKTAVCSAFTTAPSECSQSLSTASPSAGFGASASSSSSSTASC